MRGSGKLGLRDGCLFQQHVLLDAEPAPTLPPRDEARPAFLVNLEALFFRHEPFDVTHHRHDVLVLFLGLVRHHHLALKATLDGELAIKLVFLW